ncbi:hypothetical protein DOJK_01576 [Patescibacteria group bacterium]|nr:hypothetical protein DOJK_01576 [Patescibacteria group bacterium]
MRWSKLKKNVEATFTECLHGKIQIHSTCYQCSCGRAWITVDGKELVDLSTMLSGLIYQCVYHETTITNCKKHPAVKDEERIEGNLIERGEFSRFDFHKACWNYLHSSLHDSLNNNNPLIVSLAVLNSKVGKQTLNKMLASKLHPLTRRLIEIRLKKQYGLSNE